MTIPTISHVVVALPAFCAPMLAQVADPVSGNAGWVGAGLLGLVLAWLLFVHLPGLQKSLRDMLNDMAGERDKDRSSRHDVAAAFTKALAEIDATHRADISDVVKQHLADAQADRLAFEKRNEGVIAAIKDQTRDLLMAMANVCKFRDGSVPLDRK